MGQTVNLLVFTFGGSNPSLPTTKSADWSCKLGRQSEEGLKGHSLNGREGLKGCSLLGREGLRRSLFAGWRGVESYSL